MARYLLHGRRPRRTLMIVHGGPGASHEYLLPYLLPLMRTSRLIFIDERASGRAP